MKIVVLICICNFVSILSYHASKNQDIDECVTGANDCDSNATCTNSPGNFNCSCNEGYSGDGTFCLGKKFYSQLT